jgi:hypothetical protein
LIKELAETTPVTKFISDLKWFRMIYHFLDISN